MWCEHGVTTGAMVRADAGYGAEGTVSSCDITENNKQLTFCLLPPACTHLIGESYTRASTRARVPLSLARPWIGLEYHFGE